MDQDNSSEGLYAACRQEGSDAQADAFRLLFGQLYRVAYGMLRARPDGEGLAADCAQAALIKVHRSLEQCREPATFQAWAAQIARRAVLDALRRPAQTRHVPLDEHEATLAAPPPEPAADLRGLLLDAVRQGPLSERSRRVIVGRFFDERADEELAAEEARLAGEPLLPSHVQVTRAKNIAKLRRDDELLGRLREAVG
jgi:RNA polymerase sigma factor (sigma-70 family)